MSSFNEPIVVDIVTDEDLDIFLKNENPRILFFWADWHGPSKLGGQMDQLYKTLSLKYGNSIKFARIEAEKLPSASLKFEIRVVPTFITIVAKKPTARVEGANPIEIMKLIENLESNTNFINVNQMIYNFFCVQNIFIGERNHID